MHPLKSFNKRLRSAVNPNPEPEWSGAHRGLCLYLSRLLLPAWEVRAITPSAADRSVFKCRLSARTMGALEAKLRALEAALGAFLARRKSRGYSRAAGGAGVGGAGARAPGLFLGGGFLEDATGRMLNAAGAGGAGGAAGGGAGDAAGGAADADAPFAKRQRMWNAFVVEEQRNAAVRALAGRAAQALALLRALAGHNVARLAARLDDATRRRLSEAALRDLVLDAEGQKLAAALIAALVGEQLDGGGGGGSAAGGGAGGGGGPGDVEELAALLQARAPAFFRDADRRFYQATARLKAAEEAASPSERAALAADAAARLLRVPQVVPLAQVGPRLVFLRQWDGLVDLCLRAAALADPENLAWRLGIGGGAAAAAAAAAGAAGAGAVAPPEAAAARAARDRCYAPFLDTLRALLAGTPVVAAPATAPAGPAAPGPVEGAPLTSAEAADAKRAICRAVTRSSDPYAHAALFAALADAGADADLLSLDGASPHLEAYLRQEGGLAAAGAGGQAGPLSARQVRHAELLCRLHVARGRYSAAAQAYRALAERRSGRGAEAVPLRARLDAFQSALLQARSVGDDALVEGLRASCRVMELQLAVHARLEALLAAARRGGSDGDAERVPALKAAVAELEAGCLDVSDLYNGHAQPHGVSERGLAGQTRGEGDVQRVSGVMRCCAGRLTLQD